MIEFDKEEMIKSTKVVEADTLEKFLFRDDIITALDRQDFRYVISCAYAISENLQRAVVAVLLLSDLDILSYLEIFPEYFLSDLPITKIDIPKNVTVLDTAALWDCELLTSVTIPNSTKSINWATFCYCGSLSKVIFEENSQLTAINTIAFAHCDSLENIIIPNRVTSIGDTAFLNCSSLTTIIIPNRVTSIGSYAFYKCSKLNTIHYEGTKQEWETIHKGKDWADNSGIEKIVCIDGEINLK